MVKCYISFTFLYKNAFPFVMKLLFCLWIYSIFIVSRLIHYAFWLLKSLVRFQQSAVYFALYSHFLTVFLYNFAVIASQNEPLLWFPLKSVCIFSTCKQNKNSQNLIYNILPCFSDICLYYFIIFSITLKVVLYILIIMYGQINPHGVVSLHCMSGVHPEGGYVNTVRLTVRQRGDLS